MKVGQIEPDRAVFLQNLCAGILQNLQKRAVALQRIGAKRADGKAAGQTRRAVGPVALGRVCAAVQRSRADCIGVFGLGNIGAELAQYIDGHCKIGFGRHRRGQRERTRRVKAGQREQQPGCKLGADIAAQRVFSGQKLSVDMNREAAADKNAVCFHRGKQHIVRAFGQFALPGKNGVDAHCGCHGEQKPQRGAAFAAIERDRPGPLVRRLHRPFVAALRDSDAECAQAPRGRFNIGARVGNGQRACCLRKCGGNQQPVGKRFGRRRADNTGRPAGENFHNHVSSSLSLSMAIGSV